RKMKPERQAGIDEKPVAAAGTSRLSCLQDEPSTRSENCKPGNIEWVQVSATREIEELDDPPQDEQEAKRQDPAPEFADSRGRRSFAQGRHEVNFSNRCACTARTRTREHSAANLGSALRADFGCRLKLTSEPQPALPSALRSEPPSACAARVALPASSCN